MIRVLLISLTILLVNSCKWDDPIEENPVVTLSSITTISQLNLGFFAGGEAALYTGMITQQVSGVFERALAVERYDFQPRYFDGSWEACYLGLFSNLSTLIYEAERHNLLKFRGIGKIMMANALGVATDLWGDIPYTETFLTGRANFTPPYDSQELIYETIFQLINEGIEDLNNHGTDAHPGNDDLFFNGDAAKWIRYANFLRLRYTLHIANREGYEILEDLINVPMFVEPGDVLAIDYGNINAQNPIYLFLTHYLFDARGSEHMINQLLSNDDPRLTAYFKANSSGDFVGTPAGEGSDNTSPISSTIFSQSANLILCSYTEQMFIISEYYYQKGMLDESFEAFKEGVKSSLLDYGINNSSWLNSYFEDINLSLEKIILAKHTALFLQVEAWSDWRRTGYPQLEAALENTTGNIIPRRFAYPQDELNYNTENVPDVSITDRVWWDVQ